MYIKTSPLLRPPIYTVPQLTSLIYVGLTNKTSPLLRPPIYTVPQLTSLIHVGLTNKTSPLLRPLFCRS